MAGPATQAHLDTLAQQMGFRDYATYSAYQQHQAMQQQGGPPPQQQAAPAQPQQPPQNWLQHLIMSSPLGYVARKFNGQ